MDGKLVIGNKHHYLGQGKPVLAAGKIRLNDQGQIRNINNLSGHYQPTLSESLNSAEVLKNAGLNVKGATMDVYQISASNGAIKVIIRPCK